MEVGALRWNHEDACWDPREEILGCESGDIQQATGPCIVRKSDGAAFSVFGIPPDSTKFTVCNSEQPTEECAMCFGDNYIEYCDPESLQPPAGA